MKKVLLALLTLAMLCACNDQVCKISGTISDPVDSVQLVKMTDGIVDVAAVKDGKFTLQNLHPSARAYEAMAECVPEELLK